MDELNTILRDATAAIEPEYYRLRIYGGPSIYRERVYCYELYHQMRCRWPSKTSSRFYLNGEVDKKNHPTLSKLGVGGIPDLLVHGPGYMERNHAIIEVKNSDARGGFDTDLEKLTSFVNDAGYARAIYLVYGDDAAAQIERIEAAARRMNDLAPIEVWLHEEAQHPAQRVKGLERKRNGTA
jgi:hypothetical protein